MIAILLLTVGLFLCGYVGYEHFKKPVASSGNIINNDQEIKCLRFTCKEQANTLIIQSEFIKDMKADHAITEHQADEIRELNKRLTETKRLLTVASNEVQALKNSPPKMNDQQVEIDNLKKDHKEYIRKSIDMIVSKNSELDNLKEELRAAQAVKPVEIPGPERIIIAGDFDKHLHTLADDLSTWYWFTSRTLSQQAQNDGFAERLEVLKNYLAQVKIDKL